MISDYERTIGEVLERVNASNVKTAIAIASIPEDIRGYGHVKTRHLDAAKKKQAELLTLLRAPVEAKAA